MIRRILISVTLAGAVLVPGVMASAPARANNPNHYWFCVANDQTDFGYCQGNPFPDRLPVIDDAAPGTAGSLGSALN